MSTLIEQIDRLAAEFGGLSDRKRKLWQRELEAIPDEEIERTVSHLLDTFEGERMPRLALVKKLCPSFKARNAGLNFDPEKHFVWCPMTGHWQGNPDAYTADEKAKLADYLLQTLGHYKFEELAVMLDPGAPARAKAAEAEKAQLRSLAEVAV